ncbi:MAG: rod shape determining protein RodA [Gaiellales bacterium]|jgi:rod shape determining protein RodA|nr:rod shape determining protein RodA [Gaiellales bacterium]
MSSVLIPGERVRAHELRRTRRIGAFGRVRRLDWLMLCALAGVAALGLDVIGTGAGGAQYVLRQEIYLALGAVALVVLSFIDVERFRKLEWPLYLGTIALVAVVFLLGFSTRGSRRWIQLPFFQFQPSEIGKLTLLLALAAVIARNAGRIGTLRFVVMCIAYAALPTGLVFVEPDFGTALVYLASLLCVLFVAGVRLRHMACLAGVAAIIGVSVLWALPAGGVDVLKPYQVDRLTSFLHPERNTLSAGYNQSQAKIAVGSGGLVGRGKSGATQTLNDFLPERRTDFVFAVLGEERGFVGAMLLLGLYLVVLWRVLRAIAVARTLYARLICAGVFGWLLSSIFISVGMTIGIAPVTGIPLPLLSAGGSSTITVLAAIGVVQAIQLRARLPQRLLNERPEPAAGGAGAQTQVL